MRILNSKTKAAFIAVAMGTAAQGQAEMVSEVVAEIEAYQKFQQEVIAEISSNPDLDSSAAIPKIFGHSAIASNNEKIEIKKPRNKSAEWKEAGIDHNSPLDKTITEVFGKIDTYMHYEPDLTMEEKALIFTGDERTEFVTKLYLTEDWTRDWTRDWGLVLDGDDSFEIDDKKAVEENNDINSINPFDELIMALDDIEKLIQSGSKDIENDMLGLELTVSGSGARMAISQYDDQIKNVSKDANKALEAMNQFLSNPVTNTILWKGRTLNSAVNDLATELKTSMKSAKIKDSKIDNSPTPS